MKKLIVLAVLLIGGSVLQPAYAEDIQMPKLSLPDLQAGVIYSIEDGTVNACTTATLLKYPTKYGDIELRGGYAMNDTPIASLCYKIGDLSSLGIVQPLHKIMNISLGVYAGYDLRDNGGFDYGLTATILSVAF